MDKIIPVNPAPFLVFFVVVDVLLWMVDLYSTHTHIHTMVVCMARYVCCTSVCGLLSRVAVWSTVIGLVLSIRGSAKEAKMISPLSCALCLDLHYDIFVLFPGREGKKDIPGTCRASLVLGPCFILVLCVCCHIVSLGCISLMTIAVQSALACVFLVVSPCGQASFASPLVPLYFSFSRSGLMSVLC